MRKPELQWLRSSPSGRCIWRHLHACIACWVPGRSDGHQGRGVEPELGVEAWALVAGLWNPERLPDQGQERGPAGPPETVQLTKCSDGVTSDTLGALNNQEPVSQDPVCARWSWHEDGGTTVASRSTSCCADPGTHLPWQHHRLCSNPCVLSALRPAGSGSQPEHSSNRMFRTNGPAFGVKWRSHLANKSVGL